MTTVGIIGAGKVGVSYGIGLFSEGPLRIGGYFSRTEDSARYGAMRTSSAVYGSIEELVEDNEVILIATPDDAIESIWRQLLQLNIQGKIVCHTAGSLSSSLFFDRTTKDVYAASIHPALAIASREEGYKSLSSAFFTVEGDPEAVSCFEAVFKWHHIRYKVLTGDKASYHLATSLISNSVIALGTVAVDLLKSVGFSEEESLDALAPLARGNLENFLKIGAVDALTGPVERGDLSTVKRHLEVLSDEKERALYKASSRILTDIAQKKHPSRDCRPMLALLEGDDDEKSNG